MEKTGKSNKTQYTIVFGGTGFIGRIFIYSGLFLQKNIIIVSRKETTRSFLDALSPTQKKTRNYFKEVINNGQILPILNFDYSNNSEVLNLFKKIDSDYPGALNKVGSIVNLSGSTSGNRTEIINSQINVSKNLIFLKKKLITDYLTSPVLIHMSSVAARYPFSNPPPYEYAKRMSEIILKSKNGCDYNVLAGFVKGLGEEKMSKAAPHIIKTFASYFNLFSLEVSVVDVEQLAVFLWYLIDCNEEIRRSVKTDTCLDVFTSNGNLQLGEVIYSLLPKHFQKKITLPKKKGHLFDLWEKIILRIGGLYLELFYPHNQEKRRIASFKKLAALQNKKDFVQKYNNLVFFGKPNKEEKLIRVKLSTRGKEMFRKFDLAYPKQLFSKEKNLLYLIKKTKKKEIVSFISKSINAS